MLRSNMQALTELSAIYETYGWIPDVMFYPAGVTFEGRQEHIKELVSTIRDSTGSEWSDAYQVVLQSKPFKHPKDPTHDDPYAISVKVEHHHAGGLKEYDIGMAPRRICWSCLRTQSGAAAKMPICPDCKQLVQDEEAANLPKLIYQHVAEREDHTDYIGKIVFSGAHSKVPVGVSRNILIGVALGLPMSEEKKEADCIIGSLIFHGLAEYYGQKDRKSICTILEKKEALELQQRRISAEPYTDALQQRRISGFYISSE